METLTMEHDDLRIHMREAFLSKSQAQNHHKVERKVRRLFLGRDHPRDEIESAAVLQLRGMVENGKVWLENHPEARVSIAFVITHHYIGGIDDGVRRGYVQANPSGIEFLKALWPWDDPCIPTVTMCKVVFDEITRSRSK